MAKPTFNQWLKGRPNTPGLYSQYLRETDGMRTSTPTTSTRPPRTTPDTPPYRGGGTRPSPGGPIPDTPPAPEPPRRTGPPTRRFPPGGGTPAPSTPPSGGGERLVGEKNIAERMAEAAKKLAARRGALKPGMVKPDTNFGRNLKTGIVGAVATHMLEDVGNVGTSLMSGDFKGAKKAGFDTLTHLPFGQTAAGVAKAFGQRGNANGILDRVLHDNYMDTDRKPKTPDVAKKEEPAAFQKPKDVGQKPLNPAPEPPSSLRGIGEQARGQSKAMRSPDSYLGSAFDATLRKGIATGRNYLQNQMNKDGLDSDMQQKIMSKYNDKIADDELLKAKGNEQGLVGAINRNDATRSGASTGRGERTLEAYRNAPYGKGAKASEIQRKFVK